MSVFHTDAEFRRARIAAGVDVGGIMLNGIDYVEVLEVDGRHQGLRVRFLRDLEAPLPPERFSITGGQRFPAVSARDWAAHPPGDARDVWLLVGDSDWSTYALALVRDGGSPRPPHGYDPVLSRVELSFKLECRDDLDCAPAERAQPELLAGPNLDYLGRDFLALRTLMLDRMSTLSPGWTERNLADLGVVLVEAIAHAADGLSYFQDAVATESYLATARRRVSVRRHARLLDYHVHEGCSARTFVAVQVSETVTLPVGTQVITRVDLPQAGIREQDLARALAQDPLVFETLHERPLQPAANVLRPHTWGEDDVVVPAGATQIVLVDPGDGVLEQGELLVLVEQYGADPDDATSGERRFADPARRHAVRLLATPGPDDRYTDPLTGDALVEVRWHPRDAVPFDVCLRLYPLPAGDPPQVPGSDRVVSTVLLGNVVLADHGRTGEPEELPERVNGERYRPSLARSPVAWCVPYDATASARVPAADALEVEPTRAQPAVRLQGDGHTWAARADLLASDAFAEDFVVEMRDDRRAQLRFGDGVHGRAPRGTDWLATYRLGGGSAGNIGTDALCHVLGADELTSRVTGVSNPLPGRGGADPESIDRVKLLAPHRFQQQERAVRPEDYQQMAQRHPEVQRAQASFRWRGSWRTVVVTVDRLGGRPVDEAFQEELAAFLEPFRMAGHDLEVQPPLFVALHVALVVWVQPDHLASAVEVAVRQEMNALFHPDRLSFGQSVYWSQIVAAVMGISGVQRVEISDDPRIRFERLDDPQSSGLRGGRLRFGAVEIPRLDADPNAPENGRLDVFLEGGL